eukprot:CAMPEP_0202859526 /NCGR_PEP_ID=MMETSP1391-20130828/1596_1 /ASSEMBLY_ACC=CAM_ASM_000867 /TAXON_ID=1034604 /ORGANISM="Chlamydomonas leiostraca, Strain SAG 11-49" /LENGTH=154 /DNA_ID=CAMNT_0049538561 /DNA_START=82 /DNA_END=546 /DNA_ORIENTATION=+
MPFAPQLHPYSRPVSTAQCTPPDLNSDTAAPIRHSFMFAHVHEDSSPLRHTTCTKHRFNNVSLQERYTALTSCWVAVATVSRGKGHWLQGMKLYCWLRWMALPLGTSGTAISHAMTRGSSWHEPAEGRWVRYGETVPAGQPQCAGCLSNTAPIW